MRTVHNTRKFGGKTFKLHDWYTDKFVASVAADRLKPQGYKVRVTIRPKGKGGRYPLTTLWYVWKRKG